MRGARTRTLTFRCPAQEHKKSVDEAREELKKAQKENDDKRDKLEKVRQPCAALASSLSVTPVLHAPPPNVT